MASYLFHFQNTIIDPEHGNFEKKNHIYVVTELKQSKSSFESHYFPNIILWL